jgi:succinate dehydrogenase / fumarate reductase, membrane anchor subunit
MVVNITSLTNNGLRDWMIQRVSAVIITLYTVFILGFLFTHPQMDYLTWRELFTPLWVKIFSLMTLMAFVLHSYIGLWTVFTDYIRPRALRFTMQILLRFMLIAFLIWGIQILWSV